MLIQFAVTNFLSFAEKTVMSMRAAPAVVRDGSAPDVVAGTTILRCGALYGANAAGKSNLVAAIEFAKAMVCEGVREKRRIQVAPFRLDAVKRAPSSFEFYIRARSNRIYGYGFAATATMIVNEWMSELIEGVEHPMFTRDKSEFRFGERLSASAAEAAQLLETVAPSTRDNQLLLRTAKELKLERFPTELQEIVAWFEDTLTIISPESTYVALLPEIDELPEFREFLGNALRSADTGILSVQTKRHKLSKEEQRLFDLPSEESEDAAADRFVFNLGRRRVCLVRQEGDEGYRLELRLSHRGADEPLVDFNLSDESDGTIRLLDLAPMFYVSAAEPAPKVYIVDELDRSMHTLLTRWLLEQFLKGATAQTSRQLLFTTHDTNLLDLEILRPDSIRFVQKDRKGASQTYSLADYPAGQLDALCGALERGYLNGRFGSIPFLGNKTLLGWPPRGSE